MVLGPCHASPGVELGAKFLQLPHELSMVLTRDLVPNS